jgi:fibronectin type 3 domain-containing protein
MKKQQLSNFNFLHNFIVIGIIVLSAIGNSAIGQSSNQANTQDTALIQIISKVSTDSLVLRWAPNHPGAWEQALKIGYTVERAEIPTDSTNQIQIEKLSNPSILPLPKENWKLIFKSDNKMAALAASQIYMNQVSQLSIDPIGLQTKQNELLNRHGFTLLASDRDLQVSLASGLGYIDKTYKKGANYLYRIYFTKPLEGIYADTALIFINTGEIDKTPLIRMPAVNAGDGKIELRWDAGVKSGFSGYYVERSEAGKNEFKRLNDEPLVSFRNENKEQNMSYFIDSIPNYVPYDYRLIGLTAFGEMSQPSDPIKAMAIDLTPPLAAVITAVKNEDKSKLRINWMFPQKSTDFDHIAIARSLNNDGPFQNISQSLNKDLTTYLDENPEPHQGNFYAVLCYDTAGNISKSLPFYGIVQDDTPPEIPLNLSGYIDTSSVVHLNWDLGKELDLQGYRVYYSNSPDHEFSNITPQILKDTIFLDTIQKRTLSKHIFYRIAAVDHNYNHSKLSPWVKVKRLDLIAPVAPIFSALEVLDTAVVLKWINSSSDDVQSQFLYRKMQDESDWTLISKYENHPFQNEFVDRNFEKKKFYEYRLQALDSSGLKSEFSPIGSVRTYDNGLRKGITEFSLLFDKEIGKNVLNWKYDEKGEYQFWLYRSLKNQPLTKYKVVKGDSRMFEEEVVNGGNNQYQYAIKVVYKNGGESPLSPIKEVETK